MKILYVEDNDDNIYVLENRLKRVGYEVIIARDGAQGVTMATAEQPDLVHAAQNGSHVAVLVKNLQERLPHMLIE